MDRLRAREWIRSSKPSSSRSGCPKGLFLNVVPRFALIRIPSTGLHPSFSIKLSYYLDRRVREPPPA